MEEVYVGYGNSHILDDSDDGRGGNPLAGLLKDEYQEEPEPREHNDLLMCELNDGDYQAAEGFGYVSGKQEFNSTLNRGQYSRPETP